MSTVIRSCPGCKSLILSDTDQCPECGHVFYERRKTTTSGVIPQTSETLKSASIHEPCPHCGEMVRSGLVRCWSCNGFMRADVAARYRDLTTNPQPIIYSAIPAEQRNEYLPARADANTFDNHKREDADEFELGSGMTSGTTPEASDFELDHDSTQAPAKGMPAAKTMNSSSRPAVAAPARMDGPDKPDSTTAVTKTASETSKAEKPAAEEKTEDSAAASAPGPTSVQSAGAGKPQNDDDLFSIAVEEQKEVRKRRGQRNAERQRKQILVPCSCGAWIRANEDQAGKSIRCKQCKTTVMIPGIRKKTEKVADDSADGSKSPAINVSWIADVWYHILAPATLVLKPGSLAGKHTEVDLAITESGLSVLNFSAGSAKKSSMFSFGSAGKVDRKIRRAQIHEMVAKAGDFKNLENVEVHPVDAARVSEIRLVQPVTKVSESMFAGVPVFGEGRIAVFLPVTLDGDKQAFLSFPLTGWRQFSEQLRTQFSSELRGTENGIPESESSETFNCFLNQSKVDSIRGLVFYQKDPAFKLELTGYKCKTCGTVVSEEGRKKVKLGGVKGNTMAKAKCPKCTSKMQAESLYKIVKAEEHAAK